MKSRKSQNISKSIILLASFSLLVSAVTPMQAQEEPTFWQKTKTTSTNWGSKAAKTLQKYAGKAGTIINKVARCTLGLEECSKEDVRRARIYAGIVVAALVALTAGGVEEYTVGWLRKKFRKPPEPTPEPTIEPTIEVLTSEIPTQPKPPIVMKPITEPITPITTPAKVEVSNAVQGVKEAIRQSKRKDTRDFSIKQKLALYIPKLTISDMEYLDPNERILLKEYDMKIPLIDAIYDHNRRLYDKIHHEQ